MLIHIQEMVLFFYQIIYFKKQYFFIQRKMFCNIIRRKIPYLFGTVDFIIQYSCSEVLGSLIIKNMIYIDNLDSHSSGKEGEGRKSANSATRPRLV